MKDITGEIKNEIEEIKKMVEKLFIQRILLLAQMI